MERAKRAALAILVDEAYLASEARAVATEVDRRTQAYGYLEEAVRRTAEARFTARVVPALANALSSAAYTLGHTFLQDKEPELSAADNIRAVKAQVDRVDLCPAQLHETLQSTEVRNAYVERVVPKAEKLLVR